MEQKDIVERIKKAFESEAFRLYDLEVYKNLTEGKDGRKNKI